MAETRKTSTAELKREAGRLVTAQRYGVAETARHLGLHGHRLRRWKQAYTTHTSAALPGHGHCTPAQAALRQLCDEGKR